MYNFFVKPETITGDSITITGTDVNHIKNVLRMKSGEQVYVSTGEDAVAYDCRITEISDEYVTCQINGILEEGLELPSDIYLFQGLPKGDKMEFIIQKAVELGVHQIIPVSMKRCVVKLDEKKGKSKVARWQSISEAAAKQSKRRLIPKIADVMTFREAMEMAKDFEVKMIPYESAEGMQKTKKIISQIQPGQKIGIFIGPEGGIDENEIALAMENGMEPVTLGRRILRTETAGMTAISWIMYHLEN